MKRIVVIGRNSNSSKILVNGLLQNHFEVNFIEEQRNDKLKLLKRRAIKFGYIKVLLQIAFQIFQRLLKVTSEARVRQITGEYSETLKPVYQFENVNSEEAIDIISNIEADLIVLSGTRILSSKFLLSVSKPIINIHAGITPKYRGVHGGYWALVNDDLDFFGSTIHRVDEGIDTGGVIKYSYCQPTEKDNFLTYPLLQQKSATFDLIEILKNDKLEVTTEKHLDCESGLWTHPTIIQYIWFRIKKGIA